jgi:predicted nucleic acid-binding protein
VFVDSGGWIAFFSGRDRHHVEADSLVRTASRGVVSLFTTNLVLAEVHRFVLFRQGIGAARTVLERIDASTLIRLDFVGDAEHRAATAWLAKLDDQSISYTDAVSFAAMDARGCRCALSFDSDFSTAGFELWRPSD